MGRKWFIWSRVNKPVRLIYRTQGRGAVEEQGKLEIKNLYMIWTVGSFSEFLNIRMELSKAMV